MKRGNAKNKMAKRSGRIHLQILPVLIWLCAVAAVVVLFRYRTQQFEVLGLTQGRMHPIAAPFDGRLKIVSVDLFDEVRKGQALAILDQSDMDAQISAIEAEIDHLSSQLAQIEDSMRADAANLETEMTATQRRLYADVETARLRILGQQIQMEGDKVTLEELAIDLKAARELLEADAIAPYEFEKAEALYNALARKIGHNQGLLEQAQQDLAVARKEYEAFAVRQPVHPSVDNALTVIRKQIGVQEKLIAQLTLQREALKLTSPVDGRVVQIQVQANQAAFRRQGEDVVRRPMEVVSAGDPILVIAETEPTEIIAYLRQEQVGAVSERMSVQVVKTTAPAQVADSQIIRMGPVMELMPQQLWHDPGVAQWGRPVLIKIPPGFKVLPGEVVGIKGL
jgi:multidrug resistance efflux pump